MRSRIPRPPAPRQRLTALKAKGFLDEAVAPRSIHAIVGGARSPSRFKKEASVDPAKWRAKYPGEGSDPRPDIVAMAADGPRVSDRVVGLCRRLIESFGYVWSLARKSRTFCARSCVSQLFSASAMSFNPRFSICSGNATAARW
jgi:hypothetical protein